MARPFSSTEAKQLIQEHNYILKQLNLGTSLPEEYQDEVIEAAQNLVGKETLKILQGIPIEEINRNKRGFRVKALRDNGYETLADLAAASVYNLSAIHGISEDSAYAIKGIVDTLADQASKDAKIRLSTDNRTPAANRLVRKIAQYRRYHSIANACQSLLTANQSQIDRALEDLQIGTSGFRWLFSSHTQKQKAQDAYDLLNGLMDSKYGRRAHLAIQAVDEAEDLSTAEAWEDFSQNSVRFFNILEDFCPGLLGSNDTFYGLPEDLAREIQEQGFFPDGLLCELRTYQEWGVKYILHQERVLLGDEMGLGKTIQAIAAMVSLRNTGGTHFVVVCPASVIENWCREIRKFSRLSVTKVHGAGRLSALRSWIQTSGVAVTTYETTGYFELDDSFKFAMLVVDEAHYIKNSDAQRTVRVKNLAEHTDRLLFLTGTALENRVDEMISLISILRPDIASQLHGMASLSSAPQFREAIAPVYYRRKQEDVLRELPEKTESEEWCTLSAEEETIYEQAVLAKQYNETRRVSWNVEDLRTSSKAKRMLELIDEATAENRKIIVFSFFLDTIRKISMLLGSRCTEPINGSVSPHRRQEILDNFERAPAGTVLLAQIQAGGTGLNIQAASVVILCEPQLKPSIENQAIARAYRMNQTRNVLVYRLLCKDTVDEKITNLLAEKQKAFDAFADKSVAAAKENLEVDSKTFGNLIQEEIDRINAKKNHQ